MKSHDVIIGLLVIGACVCLGPAARAEEITLKDGQKIVGTIVGYEKDMFRVKTDYGIALVRKDKVVSIEVSKPAAAKTNAGASAHESKESPRTNSGGAGSPLKPDGADAETPAVRPPPPPSHPVDMPIPAHVQDHVDGSTYYNDTFQFSMFKPPDWKIYEGVPKETGTGIMAMGALDEQTLLMVDRQAWSGPPKLSSDQVEAKLRQTYQDFQRISEEPVVCDGQTAVRRTFTGILDGAEWHGVAVHVIHGNTVFGIIGLTSAETFEFQEAIFNKIIRTFHFLPTTPPTLGGPATPTP